MDGKVLTWKIAGVGGYGLQTASMLLTKTFLRGGFYVHGYDEFASIIKGGPATSQVSISPDPLRSHRSKVDLLICLNQESLDRHLATLQSGAWVLFDSDVAVLPANVPPGVIAIPLPLTKMTLSLGVEKLMRSVATLGASLALFDYPLEETELLLREAYGHKGEEVVDDNVKALRSGAEYLHQQLGRTFPIRLKPRHRPSNRMIMTGNEALSLGSIASACRFYAAYPMTPSSSILSFMVKHGPSFGMVVRQLPDEIAVANQAIGASHAGVRSMVGTSGGGFSLMVESLGLAAMTETPLVVVDAQRPGPATGLPTWTEQGDLRFVMHAAQGDFPRVVLAPGDTTECFKLMPMAFNLADRYQIPVIVLTDKYLADSLATTDAFPMREVSIDRGPLINRGNVKNRDSLFPRYADTKTGVSNRPIPGTPGHAYLANSDEHDVFGLSNEDADVRITQQSKRMRKLEGIQAELPEPTLFGSRLADLTIVAWGSTKGPVLDAIDMLSSDHLHVNFLYTPVLWPFPSKDFGRQLHKSKRVVVVEGNATGQLASLIEQETGLALDDRLLRFDGRPFEAVELAEEFRKRIRKPV